MYKQTSIKFKNKRNIYVNKTVHDDIGSSRSETFICLKSKEPINKTSQGFQKQYIR